MERCVAILFFVLGSIAVQAQGVPVYKLAPALQQQLNTPGNDSIAVSFSLLSEARPQLAAWRIKKVQPYVNMYVARLSRSEITTLAAQKEILLISPVLLPVEELSTGAVDYTLNGITTVHHRFPLVKGEGISASIKERAFDTSDIDFKGRTTTSGLEAPAPTSHASLMTTIVAGGGNTSPAALGGAPGAVVSSTNFANLFPDPENYFLQKNITVQNHSYGTVVENFYGNEAATYDAFVRNQPNVLHVFSAGNSGTLTPATGLYSGVAQMANLTGNFKQSKNTISVSALDSFGAPLAAASRGPAYDGRLKPEIAAYGEDGSSGAAALVSGTALLVQDAYLKRTTAQKAPAALIKAVLLNSARDVGAKGPDYLTGYGSLQAADAVQTVQEGRYFEGTVTAGEIKRFTFLVPANATAVKATLVWTDAPAQPNAAKALINDLDLVVRNSTMGQRWQPWILNTQPVKDSLLLPARRGVDTLNNSEQAEVENPAAGMYEIEVSGSRLFTSQQTFAVAFSADTQNTFQWNYPLASDVLESSRSTLIRWNSNLSLPLTIQYSLNGTTWQNIGTVPGTAAQIRWSVPTAFALAQVRAVAGSGVFVSDTFVVSPSRELSVGFNCADSLLLYWNALPSAQYRLLSLGNQYLQPVVTTPDTSALLRKSNFASDYLALQPLINGRPGLRSATLRYASAGTGCYFSSFVVQSQTQNNVRFSALLGTLSGVKEVALQRRSQNNFNTRQTLTPFSGTDLSFTDTDLLSGENTYRLQLTLLNGRVVYSHQLTVIHLPAETPVLLYPNPAPAGGQLYVLSNESGRYTITLYPSSGSAVYTRFITSTRTPLPASGFPAGFYFAVISDKEGHKWVQKIIIQ